MNEKVRIPPDVRLDDGPMVPLRCRTCAAQVEVRKSSWEQTSIQWNREAVSKCRELHPGSAGPGRGLAADCRSLASSISEAALSGSLPVHGDDPLPVNRDAGNHEEHIIFH